MAASYAGLYHELVARRAATPGVAAPNLAASAKAPD
jgi:hypothetical protein